MSTALARAHRLLFPTTRFLHGLPTARMIAQMKDALANGDTVYLDLPHYITLEVYDPKWREPGAYVLRVHNRVPRNPTLDHSLAGSKLQVLERVAAIAGAAADTPCVTHEQFFRMLVQLLYDHKVNRVRFHGAYHGSWQWDAHTSRWNGRGAGCSSSACSGAQ